MTTYPEGFATACRGEMQFLGFALKYIRRKKGSENKIKWAMTLTPLQMTITPLKMPLIPL